MNSFDRVLYTIPECMTMSGIGRASFYRSMKAGELPYRKVAGLRRIHVDDLKAFLKI